MLQITPTLFLPDTELTFTFVRSSGPGGQNVNKVATAAQLRFDVRNSPSLPAEVKDRLVSLAGARLTQDGVLVIEAKRYRGQEQNRLDAIHRLAVIIQKAPNRTINDLFGCLIRLRRIKQPNKSVHLY